MPASGTKNELLSHLDKLTREATPTSVTSFTTAKIASDINVSRSLASQYLNELVRDGLIVKVNTRPVIYLHKAAFERYLQATLSDVEYPSMTALLREAGVGERPDFEKAIGHDLSLAPSVDQLKAAITYPPSGLPILLAGESGCGKALLARLTFEYGQNHESIGQHASYVRLDCARYSSDDAAFRRCILGSAEKDGLLTSVNGGVAFFENVDALGSASRETLLALLDEHGRRPAASAASRPRFILSISQSTSSPAALSFVRAVPIVVSIPPLRERTLEERTNLVLHFMRAQGRRVSADVSITRGALRMLVEANFEDNVDGLRTCVINCCAGAYVGSSEAHLEVRAYNLPASVLGTGAVRDDDDCLVSCGRNAASQDGSSHQRRLLEGLLGRFAQFEDGAISFGELLSGATLCVREYQDYLNFEGVATSPRIMSYEQVLNGVFEAVGMAHDVDLTRKSSRLLAQCLASQLFGGDLLARWKQENVAAIERMGTVFARHLRETAAIVEQVSGETKTALGLEPDALARLVLALDVNSSVADRRSREYAGIVCCHGYSTATSIADAANRILHAHVFDAVDMTYDQQVTDVVRPLRRCIERYSYCKGVVLLVDMGSLTELASALSHTTDVDLFIINNVSTGLALEVGSMLKANEPIEAELGEVVERCRPAYSVARCAREADAVVFCSESGTGAADKIRRLFAESLPADAPIELVVADYQELAKSGLSAPVFSRNTVRAIVGTMNPGIEGVAFLALEDILYEGPTQRLDKVFSRSLGEREIKAFHASLLKRLTLQNVIESITILNPEKLYTEVSSAVGRLAKLTEEEIAPAATIGLYVHLCCLVERLVTKTPIDVHANEQGFCREHAAFIEAFRSSFSDISDHYHVEVPVTEIAYVFDYISSKSVTRERDSAKVKGETGQLDE